MKIVEYKVVEDTNIEDFVEQININIRNGWQPLGGIESNHEHIDENDVDGRTFFFQSMIKYEENKPTPLFKIFKEGDAA